jgi:hypothetical protein
LPEDIEAMNLPRAAVIALAFLLSGTPALEAQATPRWRPDAGVGEVTFLGANTLIGALAGGIFQTLRGGSFSDGFTRGALGGAVVYAGKRLSGERFSGAGFLGREIAAVGASIVRNAGDGGPSLQRLVLPVGPLRLHLYPKGNHVVNLKVDLYELAWLGYAMAEPALTLEVGKTFSAGAPVFLARNRSIRSGEDQVQGVTGAGTILIGGRDVSDEAATFAHERVHVIQRDFYSQAWFLPLEERILRDTPLAGLQRYVDINILTPLWLSAWSGLIGRENRPEEIEASFLELR